jgi:Bacterial PH domain
VKHDPGQFHDLPAPLPSGERVIWQGRPTFMGLALRAFHIREVAIYFGLILMWLLWSNWASGASIAGAAVSALWLIVPALGGMAILAALASLYRRTTQYTITSRRVLLQFGAALPMTMNIPLKQIAGAALRTFGDGSGDIPLKLADGGRVSFILLWPHVRPWRLRFSEPMLRAVPDAPMVAAKLAEALSGEPEPIAVAMSQFARGEMSSATRSSSASIVAA